MSNSLQLTPDDFGISETKQYPMHDRGHATISHRKLKGKRRKAFVRARKRIEKRWPELATRGKSNGKKAHKAKSAGQEADHDA